MKEQQASKQPQRERLIYGATDPRSGYIQVIGRAARAPLTRPPSFGDSDPPRSRKDGAHHGM